MKLRGSRLTETELLDLLVLELSSFTGLARDGIKPETRLADDLGVTGDDGAELFQRLDDLFEVDWTGLDLGVHFGNEGFGLPLPWHLANNCVSFEHQPLTVEDLLLAIRAERWPGSPKIPVSARRRR